MPRLGVERVGRQALGSGWAANIGCLAAQGAIFAPQTAEHPEKLILVGGANNECQTSHEDAHHSLSVF